MPTIDEGPILDLGKTPVPGAAPAGADAADDPDYILVNAEMSKTDRVDTGPPEWHEIERAATDVLRLKSKDVEMACCLGLALFRKDGRWHHYRLPGAEASPAVQDTLEWLQSWVGCCPAARQDARRLKSICRKKKEKMSACYRN